MNPKDALAQLRGTLDVCGCGRPLHRVLDEHGLQIGMTHDPDDAEGHSEFFGRLRVVLPANSGGERLDPYEQE